MKSGYVFASCLSIFPISEFESDKVITNVSIGRVNGISAHKSTFRFLATSGSKHNSFSVGLYVFNLY